MNRLSEVFKGLYESWNKSSTTKKIALAAVLVGILTAVVYLLFYFSTPKYAVLFSNMDSTDSGAIIAQLKTDKVSYQVKGTSILVPESQVDSLRMDISSSVTLTNGSQGWELIDSTKFGATDAQMQINYQRALEGEIEKTIKSFPQIQGSRVHLVIPTDSVFVSDSTKATASVTLQLKAGQNITNDQVKAIVALVCGSVKNLPKENVDIVDDKLKLLTSNLYNNTDTQGTSSVQNQQQIVTDFEKQQENKILDMLQKTYKDKVTVKVNADMNFDAVQSDSVKYDQTGTVVSEHAIVSPNSDTGTAAASGSTVDTNMVNTTPTTNTTTNSTTANTDITKNYNVGQTETKTIKAPGTINRITASVLVDGTLDNATKSSINNIVETAIGYNAQRGDTINIESMKFDTTVQAAAKKALQDIAKETSQQNTMNLVKYGLIALGILAAFIFLLRITKKNKEVQISEDEIGGLDVLVGDDLQPSGREEFAPINFEGNAERNHLENEIKKYATEKPEQVVDIIKSWLAEDER